MLEFAETQDAMDSDSPFWIDRKVVGQLQVCMETPGKYAHILAPRDVGKSSILYAARQSLTCSDVRVVCVDFLMLINLITDLDTLCQQIIESTLSDLDLPRNFQWDARRQPPLNFMRVFEKHIFPCLNGNLVLALDHIEHILNVPNFEAFFGGLRGCHTRRLTHPVWKRFGLVLIGRTDANSFIPSAYQSPFTIGEEIRVDDFNTDQLAELNRVHGEPFHPSDIEAFSTITGGHPRLVQIAFNIQRENNYTSLTHLSNALVSPVHPFGRFLQNELTEIRNNETLAAAMKRVLEGTAMTTDVRVQELMWQGWVKIGDNEEVEFRCGLFSKFFGESL